MRLYRLVGQAEYDLIVQSGTVTFTSGWMVEPKGKIRLATPYGDK